MNGASVTMGRAAVGPGLRRCAGGMRDDRLPEGVRQPALGQGASSHAQQARFDLAILAERLG